MIDTVFNSIALLFSINVAVVVAVGVIVYCVTNFVLSFPLSRLNNTESKSIFKTFAALLASESHIYAQVIMEIFIAFTLRDAALSNSRSIDWFSAIECAKNSTISFAILIFAMRSILVGFTRLRLRQYHTNFTAIRLCLLFAISTALFDDNNTFSNMHYWPGIVFLVLMPIIIYATLIVFGILTKLFDDNLMGGKLLRKTPPPVIYDLFNQFVHTFVATSSLAAYSIICIGGK